MKKNVLILILILFGSRLFAQTFTVQGKVTDAKTNEALVGVSVVEKGTTNGVVTDIDGRFLLPKMSPNGTLIFSYIGFISQDIEVKSSEKTLNIALEEADATFKEIVVIGYGTQRKSDVTGAVASVKGKDIATIRLPWSRVCKEKLRASWSHLHRVRLAQGQLFGFVEQVL